MFAAPLVIVASFAYLLLLFAVAWIGDRRAQQGRSIIDNAWTYALSMAVYCTAWTYFGSVGRAASGGVWFLPIYLGPTLAMVLAWMVVRKMIRIAKTYRITSIADFVASRYGKPAAGRAGDADHRGRHRAVHRAAVEGRLDRLRAADHAARTKCSCGWRLVARQHVVRRAASGRLHGRVRHRHLDAAERHEGMVAAIAFESIVKLLAFMAVGVFVTWGMFGGRTIFSGERSRFPTSGTCSAFDRAGLCVRAMVALTVLSMLS
jgi:hypothetical protein